MAAITSTGIGSGLDVEGLVSKLMAAESKAPTQRLDSHEAKIQAQLSALGSVKGALSDFQSALSGLTTATAFNKRTATSSDTDILTVTATSIASAGTYDVDVQKLAQAHKVASDAANPFADTTSAVGTGTLTFDFGTYDSGANTFTTNADKASGSVTIDATDNSLSGIRDAVNNADIGVRASIVNDGTGYRLVFASNDSGAANSLKVTVSGDSDASDVDNAGLSQLAYDPTAALGSGKNMSETVAAQDALVTVDGIDITSDSNTISGAIHGVTLNLQSAAPGTTETVTVAEDKSGVDSAIGSFVDGFNSLIKTFNTLTSYNADTGQAGVLIGDASIRGIESQIRGILGDAVPGLNGAIRSMADLGITTARDGTLSVDQTKLTDALNNNFDDVAAVFAATGQASDSLIDYKASSDLTQAGTYTVNVSQLATQGSYAGGAATLTLASDESFALKVDGVQTAAITIAAGTYTGDELAAQLQSKINGDGNLQDGGISVKVSYANPGFDITSDLYGSDSSVEVTTANATLGLTAGAGTAGVDVAGTIGGRTATGSGQTLSADGGDAAGLQINILGGSLGNRGSVVFSRGVADRLDSLLGNYLDSDGLLASRTDSLNSQLSDISDQRQQLQDRLDRIETRYRKQFTQLDTMMAQMQGTSSYLSQQLASLPG